LITAQFQTGYPTSSTGTGILAQGVQTDVKAVFAGPATRIATSGPINFGNSWVFKTKRVQWFSSNVTYTADPNTPLVTVITPSATGTQGVSASVTYAPGQATVTFSDGKTLVFTLGPDGWKF
jgi:hypothetical protein